MTSLGGKLENRNGENGVNVFQMFCSVFEYWVLILVNGYGRGLLGNQEAATGCIILVASWTCCCCHCCCWLLVVCGCCGSPWKASRHNQPAFNWSTSFNYAFDFGVARLSLFHFSLLLFPITVCTLGLGLQFRLILLLGPGNQLRVTDNWLMDNG